MLLALGYCFRSDDECFGDDVSSARTDVGGGGPQILSRQTEINHGVDRGGGTHENRIVRGNRQSARSGSRGAVSEPVCVCPSVVVEPLC